MKSYRVGNHVFFLVCGTVEIYFFLELLYMTIAYIAKTENPWLQGRQTKPQGNRGVTRLSCCCCSMSPPVLGLFMSCCTLEWEEEYKTVDRDSSHGLACVTLPGDKLHSMKETCLCTLRYTQPTSIASMREEVLSAEDRLIYLVKNIYSSKPLTQNTIVLVGPRQTTRQTSELYFSFSFLYKKWKKTMFLQWHCHSICFCKS